MVAKFADIKQVTIASYRITVPWTRIQRQLDDFAEAFELDLDPPPYQWGHVWTEAQQVAYVSAMLTNVKSGREIYFNAPNFYIHFNAPNFYHNNEGDNLMELVDGKQRLTAIRRFLDNEIPGFGAYYNEYEDDLRVTSRSVNFNVNDLDELGVLTWYRQLNSGVAHTPEELNKVDQMIVGFV